MKEKFINVFVDRMMNYLNHLPDVDATVGVPYLISNDQPISYDITGIIGISGVRKGCVYFTAPKAFLSRLLILQGEKNLSEENLLDMAGEIANTISGNVRSEFGQNFMISVPIVVKGRLNNMHLPKDTRSYVIPISWKDHTPVLTVSLEDD
ncbi:MAG: chemotaxis protein CheX [Cellvibrionaceae bacterium]